RYASAAAHHRLQNDGRQILGVLANQGNGRLYVVVVRKEERHREVERRTAVRECEHPTVIAFSHSDDLGAAGDGARHRQRHYIGSGAGVAAAHALDGRETVPDRSRVLRLIAIGSAKSEPVVNGLLHGRGDRWVGMAVEPGTVFGYEV